jgi:hypothetical protein
MIYRRHSSPLKEKEIVRGDLGLQAGRMTLAGFGH